MTVLRVVPGLAMLPIILLIPSFAGARSQIGPGDCVPTLDGALFAFLLPEYAVWEEFFGRAQSPETAAELQDLAFDLHVSQSAVKTAASLGSVAVKRAAMLRGAPARSGGPSPDTLASDVILEARDDLLRSLSHAELDRLTEHVQMRRRQARYTFPKRGTRASGEYQIFKCPISVHGKQNPELIPEAYYWEFHLRVLASISSKYRTGPDTFEEDYLSSLRQLLRIPDGDIISLLNHASRTTATVDALRNAPGQDDRAGHVEAAVAGAVQEARVELMRSLPKSSWMAIERHAKSRRGGIVYDFPTSL